MAIAPKRTRVDERRLVFTSVGDRHLLHPSVLHGAGFDLMVYFYGSDRSVVEALRKRGGALVERRGGKFPNLLHAYQSDPQLFDRYGAVLVVDDDLALKASDITRLFAIRDEFDLWIVQPAFDPRGRVSYRYSMPRAATRLRFTNFVETNAPLFKSEKLRLFMDHFSGELAGLWGTDWWYMNVIGIDEEDRYAVADEVVVANPEERGGMREIHRLETDDAGLAAWRAVRDRDGLREIAPMVYSGVAARYPARARALTRNAYFFLTAPKEIRHRQLPLWLVQLKRRIRELLPQRILRWMRKG
jgi:hypothetical protein